jgi:hypothetical protein
MRNLVRGIFIVFAVIQGIIGVWASIGPASFFDDGPLPGLGWVRLFPPYNEHLVRDFGGMNLTVTVLFIVAAVKLTPLLVRLAAGGYFLFALPHTIYHTIHLEHFTPTDAVIQTTGLYVMTLLLVIAFAAAGRLERTPLPV